MWSKRFRKYIPTAETLKSNRFLQPFSQYLHHHFLWQFNRRMVAGGVAVGLFFGILLPFLQILFAALAAILFRVNLPVAAFSTFISNPLTFPGIYYLAYLLGKLLIEGTVPDVEAAVDVQVQTGIAHVSATQHREVLDWFPRLIEWGQSVGLPLSLGLFVLACASALIGYTMVSVLWDVRSRLRWRKRQISRR